MKAKMILTAAVLAVLAGGYQGFAEDMENAKYVDVNEPTTLTDAELAKYDYDLSIKNSYYTGTTPDAALTVTEDPDTATSGGVVLADMAHSNKTFQDLNSFTVQQTDSEKFHTRSSSGVIVGSSNGTITFAQVKNINLGSADHWLNNNGPVIHGFSGTVSIDGTDSLNIYAEGNAVMAQQGNASDFTGNVTVRAGDIHIEANAGAVVSSVFRNTENTGNSAVVDLTAENSIYVGGTKALQIKDYMDTSTYGKGTANITLHAGKDITLVGKGDTDDSGYGVYLDRKHEGESDFTITSEAGNVNIEGTRYGVYSHSASADVEGTISGKTVNISSADNGTGISLSGGNQLMLAGDTVNVSGGTAVDAQNGSKLTFGDGEHATDVNINGYINVTGENSTLTFAKDTTTHVDSKYLTNQDKSFITTGGTGTVIFADGAKLDIGDIKTGTALNFSDNTALNTAAANAIKTDNLLQQVTFDTEGNMTVGTVDNKEAAALLGGSALTNVALYATGTNNDSITNLITSHVDDTAAIEEALNSAAGLASMANTAHGTYTMNGIFSDAVSGHLMNRQDQDVWAYGFHSKENVNGLSFGADYDAQYNGIAAGVDFYRKGGTAAGLALIYADSNVSGANGVSSTKNDADYYGVSLYSRFDRGSYALLGDISYMKGDHDITQVNSGETITASPDSDSISVGVKAVKDYAAGENGTLTPYVGLRYLRLSTDDFTASNGLHYEGDDQDLVIVPVGVNYTAAISHGKWNVRPYAGIGYVWTAGDRSADQTVMLGTAADSFSYDTADSGSFVARAGVTTDCGDMSYGIGYSWQKGDSVSNNGWTLSASYHF